MRNRRASEVRSLLPLVALVVLSGCGRGDDSPRELPLLPVSAKARFCPPSGAAEPIAERQFLGQRFASSSSFEELRDALNSSCKDCHQAPAQTKHVSFIDSYKGEVRTIGGVTKFYPGFFEMADDFAEALTTPDNDEIKQMPPKERRDNNPDGFLRIGNKLKAWIAAGKPAGAFSFGSDDEGAAPIGNAPRVVNSELGDCVPRAEAVGYDIKRDAFFASAKSLPRNLLDTDLTSLDAFELAQKGTVAYNVEYPLWADNAEKGRWVHVPAVAEGGKVVRQSIDYDAASKTFRIPENTRFYKTFYKQVRDATGKSWFRRVETRVIVVRYPAANALFGTYRWDATEQVATLVDTPYRDGTPWKDTVFSITTDESSGAARKYLIPARHRCVECHMGSESKSFVLGFTPLQVNRRNDGDFARNPKATPAEISLAARLAAYGVVSGMSEPPRLEAMGDTAPRNLFELKAQAYAVGNCAHCHNPNGFAKANGVDFTLAPGALFQFNTYTMGHGRILVSHDGDLGRSYLYSKIADPPSQQGILSRMPMHTPALPDCAALRAIGKWIRSFEGPQAAEAWEPDCKPVDDDWDFVPQDFTAPKSDHYVPRRNDWADRVSGMPQKFRDLTFTPGLQALANRSYAVGYWNEKNECKFPAVNLPVGKRRPWMIDGQGQPKYPFGQVYFTTPGSWFFRTNCIKCHGPRADGDTALARGILNWSGGDVRVANLAGGLFGNRNANQSLFDYNGKNLAGNYLIWMAMEGTRVKFPPDASNFIGKHGAQMLNRVRDTCLRQISPEKASSPNYPEHEVYRDVCFFNNLAPGDAKLRFDPATLEPLHPEEVEAWLDRAAYNAGWMIFQYLRDGAEGNWRPGNDECEKAFPRPTP
jgi:mono/diheme cytochrome c family protein